MPAATQLLPWAGAWADAVPDPDAALLRRFAADRDPAAFAVLVRRYGPLVFGACLRTAGRRPDAEDAFQAVFLILAQKAGEVTQPDLLGNWLYGVAVRVGRKAQRAARRRAAREAAMAHVPRPPTPAAADWSDAAPMIDEELGRLAEHYRTAILLCDVQGLSRADAAERLGIAEGTLSSRLNAGRKKLAERLTRRGVTLGAAAVGTLLVGHAAAAVPDELTTRLAAFLQHLSAGVPIGGPVGDLLHEGWAMRTKLWASLAALGLGAAGATFAAWPGGGEPQEAPPKADEPKPLAKADGDKPVKAAKPKLIDTITADLQLGSPVWSADGKTLFVSNTNRGGNPITTQSRTGTMRGYWTTPEKGKSRAAAEFTYPVGGFLGFYDGGSSYAVYSAAGKRINAPDMLVFSRVQQPQLDGKPSEADGTRVEIDVAEVGKPFAISPDGKSVFSEQSVPVTGAANVTVTLRVLDPKTGDEVRNLGSYGDGNQLVRGYKLSWAADRLFIYFYDQDSAFVVCQDVTTGKRLWDTRLAGAVRPEPREGATSTLATGLFVPSRDGKRLAVLVSKDKQQEAMETRVLDATTGKSLVELQGQRDGRNVGLGFSHDGRMLVGKTMEARPRTSWSGQAPRPEPGPDQLVVWDLKTGKILRAWDDGLAVEVAFAPDRAVLAIVEREQDRIPGGRGGGGLGGGLGQPGSGFGGGGGRVGGGGPTDTGGTTPTITYKTTIGFWDLSPLVK